MGSFVFHLRKLRNNILVQIQTLQLLIIGLRYGAFADPRSGS